MKAMKSLIAVTFLVVSTTLMAQTTRTNNYADQAFKQTCELVSSLNLSAEQTVEILIINQKYMNMEAYNATNSELSSKEAKKATKAKNKLAAAQAKEIKSVLKKVVTTREESAPEFAPSLAFNSAAQTIYLSNPNF